MKVEQINDTRKGYFKATENSTGAGSYGTNRHNKLLE
jgi:hypothetical protein